MLPLPGALIDPFYLRDLYSLGIALLAALLELCKEPGMLQAGCMGNRSLWWFDEFIAATEHVKWFAFVGSGLLLRARAALRIFQRNHIVVLCPGEHSHHMPAIFKIEPVQLIQVNSMLIFFRPPVVDVHAPGAAYRLAVSGQNLDGEVIQA